MATTSQFTPEQIVPDFNAETALPGLRSCATYDQLVIPFLLQKIPDYAKACLGRTAHEQAWSEEQLQTAVRARFERRASLLSRTAISKTVIVTEAGLREQQGSPETMVKAVSFVAEMFANPPENTTLRLVPMRAVPGTENLRGGLGDYTITESDEHGTTIWTQDCRDFMRSDPFMQHYQNIHMAQRDTLAVPNDQAMTLIEEAIDFWKE